MHKGCLEDRFSGHAFCLSVSPLKLTPSPQLKTLRYLKKGSDDAKWESWLTGDKKEIYTLARQSYLAVKSDGDGGKYDMIHTENFILVDPEQRIRGFYDGTDSEALQILVDDILLLKKEYLIP